MVARPSQTPSPGTLPTWALNWNVTTDLLCKSPPSAASKPIHPCPPKQDTRLADNSCTPGPAPTSRPDRCQRRTRRPRLAPPSLRFLVGQCLPCVFTGIVLAVERCADVTPKIHTDPCQAEVCPLDAPVSFFSRRPELCETAIPMRLIGRVPGYWKDMRDKVSTVWSAAALIEIAGILISQGTANVIILKPRLQQISKPQIRGQFHRTLIWASIHVTALFVTSPKPSSLILEKNPEPKSQGSNSSPPPSPRMQDQQQSERWLKFPIDYCFLHVSRPFWERVAGKPRAEVAGKANQVLAWAATKAHQAREGEASPAVVEIRYRVRTPQPRSAADGRARALTRNPGAWAMGRFRQLWLRWGNWVWLCRPFTCGSATGSGTWRVSLSMVLGPGKVQQL